MKRFLITALAVLLVLCAGCSEAPEASQPGGASTQTTATTSPATSIPAREYTWDVTVAYRNFDIHEHGEAVPAVTMANSGSADQVLRFDTADLSEDEIAAMLDEENRLIFTGELRITDPSSSAVENPEQWSIDDGGSGVKVGFEIITSLTEGDYDTHGELLITLTAPDYVWNVEVVYENGACGQYEFTNPGLTGWEMYGEQYMNQVFTVTPENSTFELHIFNHQDWIVDNTRSWYQWVVFDVDDECPDITYEIVKPLTMGERNIPGTVKIIISLP